MKFLKILLMGLLLTLAASSQLRAQIDAPSGYTVHYALRMWDEGKHPSADSLNQNWKDIDTKIYSRQQTEDSLRSAWLTMHTMDGIFNADVNVFGTGGLGGGTFKFGTYQGRSMAFKTQGVSRIYINGTGGITLGPDTVTGVEYLKAGNITAFGNFYMHSGYGTTIKHFVDADGNYNIANTSGNVVFGNTDLSTWNTVMAGNFYKEGNQLISDFGTKTASGLYLAASSGGLVTTQLNYVNLTVNGTTYKVLVADP